MATAYHHANARICNACAQSLLPLVCSVNVLTVSPLKLEEKASCSLRQAGSQRDSGRTLAGKRDGKERSRQSAPASKRRSSDHRYAANRRAPNHAARRDLFCGTEEEKKTRRRPEEATAAEDQKEVAGVRAAYSHSLRRRCRARGLSRFKHLCAGRGAWVAIVAGFASQTCPRHRHRHLPRLRLQHRGQPVAPVRAKRGSQSQRRPPLHPGQQLDRCTAAALAAAPVAAQAECSSPAKTAGQPVMRTSTAAAARRHAEALRRPLQRP